MDDQGSEQGDKGNSAQAVPQSDPQLGSALRLPSSGRRQPAPPRAHRPWAPPPRPVGAARGAGRGARPPPRRGATVEFTAGVVLLGPPRFVGYVRQRGAGKGLASARGSSRLAATSPS